jgi:hypothetical protein
VSQTTSVTIVVTEAERNSMLHSELKQRAIDATDWDTAERVTHSYRADLMGRTRSE